MSTWIHYEAGWAIERRYDRATGDKVSWRAWRLDRHGLMGER